MSEGELIKQQIKDNEVVILFFAAASCGVCQAVKPRIFEIAERYHVPYLRVSVEDNLEYASQMLVFTVPTVLIFYQDREICRESRFIDFENIEKIISAIKS